MDTVVVQGEERSLVGGAGFITAVAARVAGAEVGLVARTPKNLPAQVSRAFLPGGVHPGGMAPMHGVWPGFRIQYDEAGIATYTEVSSGLEGSMEPGDFPRRWLQVPWVHTSPLGGSVECQRDFVAGLRARGWKGRLSVGTFLRGVRTQLEALRELIEDAELLFLNQAEFGLLFENTGLPDGLVVYETCGQEGVRVHRGGEVEEHPAMPVEVLDPTGAGDAFCGGVLGAVSVGADRPVSVGMGLAGQVLGGWGAVELLDRISPVVVLAAEDHSAGDGLAKVDPGRVKAIGQRLKEVATAAALHFSGYPFPEVGEPYAAESLAVATLHQYGFWTENDKGYIEPMVSNIGGQSFKGSDYIWASFTRAIRQDPGVLDPERMASDPLLFDRICVSDEGICPVPDVGSHRALQQGFGLALQEQGGFGSILARVNAAPKPARALLDILRTMPGYAEDPLAKKAMLLVVVLSNRPENFLKLSDPESIGPIVDYHIMRGCLRTGCVRVLDADLRERIESRAWVTGGEEAAIRKATMAAMRALCLESGLGVDAVDGYFFSNGRTRCLEMEPPSRFFVPPAIEFSVGSVVVAGGLLELGQHVLEALDLVLCGPRESSFP